MLSVKESIDKEMGNDTINANMDALNESSRQRF